MERQYILLSSFYNRGKGRGKIGSVTAYLRYTIIYRLLPQPREILLDRPSRGGRQSIIEFFFF